MVKNTLHGFLCGALAIFVSNEWLERLVEPSYANHYEDAAVGLIVAQVFLSFSFVTFFFLLSQAIFRKLSVKRYAILGLIFPIVFSLLSLLETTNHVDHMVGDVWILFGGAVVITGLLVSFLILAVYDELPDKKPFKKEKQCIKAEIKEEAKKETASPTVFVPTPLYASEELTTSVHNVTSQLQKAKTLFSSDVEVLHQLEKMETQIEESKLIYNRISTSYLEKAENMLKEIVVKMEVKLVQLFDQYNEDELKKLEKILLQQ